MKTLIYYFALIYYTTPKIYIKKMKFSTKDTLHKYKIVY